MLFCLLLSWKMQQVACEGEFSCKKILLWHVIAGWWHELFISVTVREHVCFHSLDLTSSSWFPVFNKYLFTFWFYPQLTPPPSLVPTARRPGLLIHAVMGTSWIFLKIHWKDWCWSWSSNTLATWYEELTHWKGLWCWERWKARGEWDDRGWDGWMASPTWQTWV